MAQKNGPPEQTHVWQDGCKAICGDGVVLGEEQCDPPMEGCDQQCKLEDGWKWVQNKTTTTCGDSLVAGEESRAI